MLWLILIGDGNPCLNIKSKQIVQFFAVGGGSIHVSMCRSKGETKQFNILGKKC